MQAQIWAYVWLGVPPTEAGYMMALYVDCRMVIRTHLACQSWERGQYKALANHGYSPEVGMAQGNVDSTDKWAAFFDPLLCALDNGQFFYQDSWKWGRSSQGHDDQASFAGTHATLQAKAELVSAFCLIFGLEVAAHKLQTKFAAFTWCGPPQQAGTDTNLHPSRRMDTSRGSATTRRPYEASRGPLGRKRGYRHAEALATTQLSTALTRTTSALPCTMDLKRDVLEGSDSSR